MSPRQNICGKGVTYLNYTLSFRKYKLYKRTKNLDSFVVPGNWRPLAEVFLTAFNTASIP